MKKAYASKVKEMSAEDFMNVLGNAHTDEKANSLLIARGADQLHSIDDLTSIYSSEREQYGAFKPNTGYKQCPAPYSAYYASYDGKIIGGTGHTRVSMVNNSGYEVVAVLNDFNKSTTVPVHRLVALCWVKNDDPEHKRVVDHKDDNKLNNNADNLAWLTYSENLTKAHRMAQMAGKGSRVRGLAVIKVDKDGTRTAYKSASAAGKANGLSAVSVTGNAKGQLKLNKPYHFIFK